MEQKCMLEQNLIYFILFIYLFIYFISRKNITKTWQMTITNE